MNLQVRVSGCRHSFGGTPVAPRLHLGGVRLHHWVNEAGCSSGRKHCARASRQETEASSKPKTYADMTIEDLEEEYCNDFVCTSSPAVEQTVRILGRDISRMKHTISLFQPDVQYSDGFRSFRGADRYRRELWPRSGVKGPRVVSY